MSMTLRPGARLFSAVCETEMIAVKAPSGELDITIGGVAPLASASERNGSGAVVEGHGGGSSMGKRYVDEAETLELLCTKSGEGVAAIGGELLRLKEAKPLPASD
jgi:hypothetical protein